MADPNHQVENPDAGRPAAPGPLPAAPGVELARLTAPSGDGALCAQFGDAPPVPVRAVVGLSPDALVEGRSVLAVRVAGEAAPIVIGVLDAPGVERLARRVDFGPVSAPAEPALVPPTPASEDPGRGGATGTLSGADGPLHLVADGRRVVVEAASELVLRCGEASLTLRADGKVVVRGTQILSHSSGPHRLKGGSFSIN